MEKGEGIKGERRGRKGDGRRESRIQGERRGRKGEGRVRYPAHPSKAPQYGLILC